MTVKVSEIDDALVNQKEYKEQLEQQEKLLDEIEDEIALLTFWKHIYGNICHIILL